MSTPNIVIFSCDRKYLRHTCCAMVSFLRHLDSKKVVDVGILTTEKDSEVKDILSRHFARFSPNPENRLIFPEFDVTKLEGLPVCARLPIATYFRLMLPQILNRSYETVLYLDSDVAVLKDVSPLFDLFRDNPDYDAAGVRDVSGRGDCERLKLPSGSTYCNSGVLVLSLKHLRDSGRENAMLDCALRERVRNDQDAINICFAGRIKVFPLRYNFLVGYESGYSISYEEYCREREDAYIAHYFSEHKPWKYAEHISTRDFAEEYFRTLERTEYRLEIRHYRKLQYSGLVLMARLAGRLAPFKKWRHFFRDLEV